MWSKRVGSHIDHIAKVNRLGEVIALFFKRMGCVRIIALGIFYQFFSTGSFGQADAKYL